MNRGFPKESPTLSRSLSVREIFSRRYQRVTSICLRIDKKTLSMSTREFCIVEAVGLAYLFDGYLEPGSAFVSPEVHSCCCEGILQFKINLNSDSTEKIKWHHLLSYMRTSTLLVLYFKDQDSNPFLSPLSSSSAFLLPFNTQSS